MKVALNLAIAPSARERYALAWALPATLLGLAGLVFIAVSLGRQLWEYRRVHQQFGELQERIARLHVQETALQRNLDQPQARKIFRDAQFVNALIEKKQISLSQLAAEITKLLPGDARLAGLALAPQSGDLRVRFTITGRNEEAVETFLGNLEDSPDFKDVALVNEGFQQQGPTSGPVTINCSARFVVASR
jgi:Tfp pilus assembly protein PilN